MKNVKTALSTVAVTAAFMIAAALSALSVVIAENDAPSAFGETTTSSLDVGKNYTDAITVQPFAIASAETVSTPAEDDNKPVPYGSERKNRGKTHDNNITGNADGVDVPARPDGIRDESRKDFPRYERPRRERPHRVNPEIQPRANVAMTGAEGDSAVMERLLKFVTPELIGTYEENIAKEPFVSEASPAKLRRLSRRLSVSEQKLKALMLLQDLAARSGDNVSLEDLAALGDSDLIKTAKRYMEAYGETLSEEERESLKAKFKATIR